MKKYLFIVFAALFSLCAFAHKLENDSEMFGSTVKFVEIEQLDYSLPNVIDLKVEEAKLTLVEDGVKKTHKIDIKFIRIYRSGKIVYGETGSSEELMEFDKVEVVDDLPGSVMFEKNDLPGCYFLVHSLHEAADFIMMGFDNENDDMKIHFSIDFADNVKLSKIWLLSNDGKFIKK